MKKMGEKKEIFGKLLRSQIHMVNCSHPECRMYAHNLNIGNDRKIFNVPQFRGKYDKCVGILHSEECKGLFSVICANIIHNNNLPKGGRKRCDTKHTFCTQFIQP